MFGGNSSLAKKGPHAIAVPGEVSGYIAGILTNQNPAWPYWPAKERYPSAITWKRIMEPTIKMCREGITVTGIINQSEALQASHWTITLSGSLAAALRGEGNFTDEGLRELFINIQTGEVWREGDQE